MEQQNEMTTRKPLLNPSNSTTPRRDTEPKYEHIIGSESVASSKDQTKSFSLFSRIGKFFRTGWAAEISSCLLAVVAFAGLIITLRVHQDKPLPQWPQLVTINSIVSIFSLLMRAGVGFVLAEGISQSKWQWFRKPRNLSDMEDFDSASRGAWGSIVLLCRFGPRRTYWIAALGCIVTIMASLTGFFTQQLVVFQDCRQLNTTANVGIARTNNFTAVGMPIGNVLFDTYPPMVAAINMGIIQPVKDYTNVLTHNCATGNCTFPSDDGASFSTVGVSHLCKNVTSEVYPVSNSSMGMMATLNMSTSLSQNRSIALPTGGSSVTLVTGAMSGGLGGSGSLVTVNMIFRASSRAKNYTAVSCNIFPTVNTYNVKIENSIMEEKLVESVPIGSNLLNDFLIPFKLATNQVLRNGTREACERKENASPNLIAVDEGNVDAAPEPRQPPTNGSKVWYYPQDCVWVFHSGSAQGIANYMNEIFSNQQLVWAERLGGNIGSVYLRQIFKGGSMTLSTVDDMFKNITTAMTSVIRTDGQNSTAEDVRGEMWYNTTCAKINWHWISFPAVMIGLTSIFLVLVAIESRGVESERLWKSSVLATLFCEVDQTVASEVKPVGKSSMSDVGSSTSVSLKAEGGALRLVGT